MRALLAVLVVVPIVFACGGPTVDMPADGGGVGGGAGGAGGGVAGGAGGGVGGGAGGGVGGGAGGGVGGGAGGGAGGGVGGGAGGGVGGGAGGGVGGGAGGGVGGGAGGGVGGGAGGGAGGGGGGSSTYTCADIPNVDAGTQVAIVEAQLNCVTPFVSALKTNPPNHLPAFYTLVHSQTATNSLWSVVYDDARLGLFRFDAPHVDDLMTNLPPAIALCSGAQRCADWTAWILPSLWNGRMYRCPSLTGMTASQLLAPVPYGDYDCTESVAYAFGAVLDTASVTSLLDTASTHTRAWARRNAVRIVGRLASRGTGDAAGALVINTRGADVKTAMLGRLQSDSDDNVLQDAIWVLDSFFYPYVAMQPALQNIALGTSYTSAARFRASAAIQRLIYSKSGLLSSSDLAFLQQALQSDDYWVRAEAAYACEALKADQHDATIRAQLTTALQAAYNAETVLIAKVYEARALDRFNGSSLAQSVRQSYEAQHLSSYLDAGAIGIRSGLDAGALPPLATRMQQEQAAFFDILGSGFTSAVPNDPNPAMTLIVFATKAEYQEYMDAFVGYGASSGGLYIEGSGTLYTFQRTAQESSYTLEHLVQHEFGHYLQGRYVYPGQWSDPGYHAQPKGWADEGFAEVLGSLSFDGGAISAGGGYAAPLLSMYIPSICANPRDLNALLSQRAGYDQAGTFDYMNGWGFVRYLMVSRRTSMQSVYSSLRSGSYTLSNFATIASVPSVSSLQTDWHNALTSWCANPPVPPGAPIANDAPLTFGCEDILRVPELSSGPPAPRPAPR